MCYKNKKINTYNKKILHNDIYVGAYVLLHLDDFDLLKVLGPPDLEGRGVEGVAGDEVIRAMSGHNTNGNYSNSRLLLSMVKS